jgi:hypothetical protein
MSMNKQLTHNEQLYEEYLRLRLKTGLTPAIFAKEYNINVNWLKQRIAKGKV